ncbi:primosomal protein N' [Pseudanabaena sp. FACHB-1998]|uniref:primosomal protein N' n=1 Tax=Pseudanabaena sp. FACHB-1998 TaxID=2692858 RepID=UPI0016815BB3|nr:primosomal protein N' [Pseudanabaena sp. FACHB-1998]MBD2177997.1 primosomal protein N' [Pseudanabaena sp. FACHB-1998]
MELFDFGNINDRPVDLLRDRFVSVIVDCIGIDDLLTYRIPEDMEIQVGDILSVPLGSRQVGAIALQISDTSQINESETEIKSISAVVSSGIFPKTYWNLLTKTAAYYRTPIMQTVKTALPPKLLDQSHYRIKIKSTQEDLQTNLQPLPKAAQMAWDFLQEHKGNSKGISRRYIHQKLGRYTSSGLKELHKLDWIETVLELPNRPQPKYEDMVVLIKVPDSEITPKQIEVLTILQHQGGECGKTQLYKLAKTSASVIQSLANKGYVVISKREILRLGGKSHTVTRDRPKSLTPDQDVALQQILKAIANQAASQFLLHGVTGSGKTEVYLQAIAPILEAGKSALVLVPEIGLTPQLTDRFRARFGDAKVNVYHSQLSEGERFDTWRLMLTGESQVVIGTRSAVFAPLANLGLIVMDEEHDNSFKQDQPQPCYHARTVAQWRSQFEHVPLVMGSATPSAEMLFAQQEQDLIYLELPNRIGNKSMPPIEVVDMRHEFKEGNYSILSHKLQQAIAEMLEAKQQGILFIHRRGYSTFVSCRSCGYVAECPNCDVSLSYHDPLSPTAHQPKSAHLRCHYCNYTLIQPKSCPECGSPYFKHFGSGTQKVEQELSKLFPNIRLIRFDSDTTRNKDQHRLLIDQFRAGEADLLVGTQMLTKGLDIPQVTLVGVVSADGLLNFSDYRAGERAAQTLLQVAGRAGRGEEDGKVIMQTYTPEHPAMQAVQSYRLEEFMQTELEMREALCYPPKGQMVLIHLSSENAETVEKAAHELAEYLRELENDWDILGATPATIAKVANRYRWQILLKFMPEVLLNVPSLEELRMLVNSKAVRVAIDVDPLTIL